MRSRVRSTIEIFSPNCPRCRSPRVQLGYENTSLSSRVFGLNELLCNNCGLTFKGFAVPGSVKRAPSQKKEIAGNRQLAPRFKVKLTANLAVTLSDSWEGETKLSPRLEGYTRDISKIGLAIVVPEYGYFGFNFSDPNQRLVVAVALPTGVVELRAAPVRREPMRPQTTTSGWLIGLRITKMTIAIARGGSRIWILSLRKK